MTDTRNINICCSYGYETDAVEVAVLFAALGPERHVQAVNNTRRRVTVYRNDNGVAFHVWGNASRITVRQIGET